MMSLVTNKPAMTAFGGGIGLVAGWLSRPTVVLGQKTTLGQYLEALGSNNPIDRQLLGATNEHLAIFALVGAAVGLVASIYIARRQASSSQAKDSE